MKRIAIACLCIMLTIPGIAQQSFMGLVQAEKNFAAFSVTHNTKKAFLQFLDSAGIVFAEGKPVIGIAQWNKRSEGPGVLSWHPQYAAIAVSDNFGFTSGPWTFRPSKDDSIVARGQYTTIWHTDSHGEWKFLVDLGVDNSPIPRHTDTGICLNLENTDPTYYRGTKNSMLRAEQKFIQLTSAKAAKGKPRTDWYRQYLNAEYVLNRNNNEPATFQDLFYKVMNEMPATIQYTIGGSGIAPSGDLGYVYGNTSIAGKPDNYLRIWRKEKSGWKIMLEVLRY